VEKRKRSHALDVKKSGTMQVNVRMNCLPRQVRRWKICTSWMKTVPWSIVAKKKATLSNTPKKKMTWDNLNKANVWTKLKLKKLKMKYKKNRPMIDQTGIGMMTSTSYVTNTLRLTNWSLKMFPAKSFISSLYSSQMWSQQASSYIGCSRHCCLYLEANWCLSHCPTCVTPHVRVNCERRVHIQLEVTTAIHLQGKTILVGLMKIPHHSHELDPISLNWLYHSCRQICYFRADVRSCSLACKHTLSSDHVKDF